MQHRSFLFHIVLLSLLASFGGGCQPGEVKPATFPPDAEEELFSAAELSRALGMKLQRTGRGMVRLTSRRHTVLLYPGEGGAFVDGKKVGSPDDVMRFGRETYVTRRLARAIRAAIPDGAAPTFPAPPAAPVRPPGRKSFGVVLLDAGHGGEDPGAISRSGLREKHVVLPVTLYLADRLRARGVDVKLTRSSDRFLSLDERVAQANRLQPDLFLSLHADAVRNRSIYGATVYVPRREGTSSRSYQAGRLLTAALARVSSGRRGMRTHPKNLRVLEYTTCPAVLVELGFLTNGTEEQLLGSSEYQQRLADALAEAIVQFLRG